MKAPLALFLGATLALAGANPPVVIYQPASPATVLSPLTNPTAQSNQALLNQINSTISQRYFQHQLLTLPAAPAVSIPVTPARVTPGR